MTDYHTDFTFSPATEPEEIVEYVLGQVRNPIYINETTVYNFSTHTVDMDALEQAVDQKLKHNLYQIPLQVQTGAIFVQELLPNSIKNAEVLMYRPEEEDYYAYHNYIRDVPIESREKTRQEIAQIIQNHE